MPPSERLRVCTTKSEKGATPMVNFLDRSGRRYLTIRKPFVQSGLGEADEDERLVFWDAVTARSSEATLSTPAATWLVARSNSEHQR